MPDYRSYIDHFNTSGEAEQMKTLERYELTPEERQKLIGILEKRDQQIDAEKNAMKDPETVQKRRDEKVEELDQHDKPPEPKLTYDKFVTPMPRSPHHKLQMAAELVRSESKQRIEGYEKAANKDFNSILRGVEKDGRGPETEQNRTIEQTRDHDLNDDRDR